MDDSLELCWLPARCTKWRLRHLCSTPSRLSCWWAIRVLMPMSYVNRCWLRVVSPAFHRDRDDVLQRGITEAFIARGTKSKTSFKGSKSTSASRLVTINLLSLSSILSSSPLSSTGLNQFEDCSLNIEWL